MNYFLDLVDLDAFDSSSIHRVLMSCLERHGLPQFFTRKVCTVDWGS